MFAARFHVRRVIMPTRRDWPQVMKRRFAILAFLLFTPGALAAAELPNAKAKPPERAKTCNVDGQPGVILPGTDTCVKLSGGIGVETTVVKGK